MDDETSNRLLHLILRTASFNSTTSLFPLCNVSPRTISIVSACARRLGKIISVSALSCESAQTLCEKFPWRNANIEIQSMSLAAREIILTYLAYMQLDAPMQYLSFYCSLEFTDYHMFDNFMTKYEHAPISYVHENRTYQREKTINYLLIEYREMALTFGARKIEEIKTRFNLAYDTVAADVQLAAEMDAAEVCKMSTYFNYAGRVHYDSKNYALAMEYFSIAQKLILAIPMAHRNLDANIALFIYKFNYHLCLDHMDKRYLHAMVDSNSGSTTPAATPYQLIEEFNHVKNLLDAANPPIAMNEPVLSENFRHREYAQPLQQLERGTSATNKMMLSTTGLTPITRGVLVEIVTNKLRDLSRRKIQTGVWVMAQARRNSNMSGLPLPAIDAIAAFSRNPDMHTFHAAEDIASKTRPVFFERQNQPYSRTFKRMSIRVLQSTQTDAAKKINSKKS